MTSIDQSVDSLNIRPPALSDVDAVAALICACDEAASGESDHADERTNLLNEWQLDSCDLTADARIAVEANGRVVGYEIVFDTASSDIGCDGYVHPDYWHTELGTNLLQWAEGRAREAVADLPADERIVTHTMIYSTDAAARRWIEAAGFELSRHFFQMRIEMDAPPPVPDWPDGITVRPFVPGQDEYTVYDVIETAFTDSWGHPHRSFVEWSQMKFNREDFDPSLWLLAYAGTEPVGVAINYPRSTMGWLQGLGVLRQARGRGLGMALLQHTFGVFYERGLRTVGLGVDAASLTGATRLYERAGMQVVSRYDRFDKVIRAGKQNIQPEHSLTSS